MRPAPVPAPSALHGPTIVLLPTRTMALALALTLAGLLLPSSGGAQAAPAPGASPQDTAGAARVARSTLVERAPAIDGRDDDAAWGRAVPITEFRTFDPVENGDPPFRTEARVVHDARNLYVFVRAFDPQPDSIRSLLSRRDVRTPSDQLKLMIDSFNDRRTGYEFATNPAGVKRDYYTFDDAREDVSWDAVWDVATKVDSLGWTAEFRIPLSQLRFQASADPTFGLMIMRDIGRTNERIAWPLYRRSRPGISSQFGTLRGLGGIVTPRRVEIAPYLLTRNQSAVTRTGFARAQQQAAGADVKLGVASNLTLDLSVNPDFGQVEADPAVLNLTAFEVFQPERRPFFLEGTGIFQAGNDRTRLFYSRRVGRAPQLAGLVSDPTATLPSTSTILGAAKLTGRTATRTSLGVLAAVTAEERVAGTMIEPRTAFGVLRVAQDFRRGESGVGFMLSGMARDLDDPTAALRLRRDAYVGGVDVRHRLAGGRYQLTGALQASAVNGSPSAIARTQRSGVHFYQRPDDALPFDSTLTSLRGTAASIGFDRTAGVFRFNSLYERITPGFETNDVGFLERADVQRAYLEMLWTSRQPRAFWRNATATIFTSHRWTAEGLPLYHNIDGWTDIQFTSQRSLFVEYWYDQWGSFCDRCAFGGPAMRMSPDHNLLLQLTDDPRKAVSPLVAFFAVSGDEGRSMLWRVRPLVRVRAGTGISGELGARYEHNRDATQWVANTGSGAAIQSLFAGLDQHTLGMSARLDYTIRPTLSLQLYAEPFVSAGRYDDVRALTAPRAARWADRFTRRPERTQPGFNAKQFRSNAVMRWEYRPGSTLFLVWQQGRDQGDRDRGQFAGWRDYQNLFAARPNNTLLLKASYWFGR